MWKRTQKSFYIWLEEVFVTMEDGRNNKRKLLIINQDSNDKASSSADIDIYREKISRLELTICNLQRKLREFESTPISKILRTATNGTRKTESYQDAFLNIQLQALRQKETERYLLLIFLSPVNGFRLCFLAE